MKNLYTVEAATWPGAGTNATSGNLPTKKILRPHAIRGRLREGGAVVEAGVAAAAATPARETWESLTSRPLWLTQGGTPYAEKDASLRDVQRLLRRHILKLRLSNG